MTMAKKSNNYRTMRMTVQRAVSAAIDACMDECKNVRELVWWVCVYITIIQPVDWI